MDLLTFSVRHGSQRWVRCSVTLLLNPWKLACPGTQSGDCTGLPGSRSARVFTGATGAWDSSACPQGRASALDPQSDRGRFPAPGEEEAEPASHSAASRRRTAALGAVGAGLLCGVACPGGARLSGLAGPPGCWGTGPVGEHLTWVQWSTLQKKKSRQIHVVTSFLPGPQGRSVFLRWSLSTGSSK